MLQVLLCFTNNSIKHQSFAYTQLNDGGARGVMVSVIGNGHGDTSSNPRQDWLHSANTLGKGMNPIILPPAISK